jgi:lipopolysaccharide/colanic/teichoic acid biosynthesis glycosyltransferase
MTPKVHPHEDADAERIPYDAAKRCVDVVLALVLIVLTLPLFVGLALAIRLTSAGPVLYRGTRVGRFGREFRQWKFRTMVVNADQLGGTKTSLLDERITPIGRRLRSSKLDELPQLFNVLCGDMSLVGPRPMVPAEVERYTPLERRSLLVRPGVTDWASVWFHDEEHELSLAPDIHEYYETHIRPDKARLRALYVRSRCFRVDISIVAQTAFVLLATRLRPTAQGRCSERPFRLWGYRPVLAHRGDFARRAPIHYVTTVGLGVARTAEPSVVDSVEHVGARDFDSSAA